MTDQSDEVLSDCFPTSHVWSSLSVLKRKWCTTKHHRWKNHNPLHKKENRCNCKNYRSISLLIIIGKVFAKAILVCLQKLAEQIYPDSQCGIPVDLFELFEVIIGNVCSLLMMSFSYPKHSKDCRYSIENFSCFEKTLGWSSA